MKRWKKYKTFKNSFQILNSCKLFPFVGIKKWRDKEVSEYNMNPSRTTKHAYNGRVS